MLDYIDIAKAEGARCLLGGKPATGDGIKGGQFVEPTIFTDVDNTMRIAREEVFGPVLSIISFDTEEDAIASPTTRFTALPPASGPSISRAPSAFRSSSAPAPCGSTPTAR